MLLWSWSPAWWRRLQICGCHQTASPQPYGPHCAPSGTPSRPDGPSPDHRPWLHTRGKLNICPYPECQWGIWASVYRRSCYNNLPDRWHFYILKFECCNKASIIHNYFSGFYTIRTRRSLTFVSFLPKRHLCFNAAFSLLDWYLSPQSASPSQCCGPCWVLTADRERWWAGHSLPGPSPDPCSWRRRPSPRCCNQTSCSSCKSWSRSTHLEKAKRKTMLEVNDPLKLLQFVHVQNQFCSAPWRVGARQIWPKIHHVTSRWRLLPGSSWGSKLLRSVFSLYQSKMRPTKADASVTLASAQATAWAKENSSVMLQWTPCFSSSSLWDKERSSFKCRVSQDNSYGCRVKYTNKIAQFDTQVCGLISTPTDGLTMYECLASKPTCPPGFLPMLRTAWWALALYRFQPLCTDRWISAPWQPFLLYQKTTCWEEF